MLLDYSITSGNAYPNPIDQPDDFPCFNCEEDTKDYHKEFCSSQCEEEYNLKNKDNE
tara:strand:- start:569 stop:739 length:171 start_codon:yes stop_codon:yes gene_type:complete